MPPIPLPVFENHLDEMLAQLVQFVEIESPSTDKAALDCMGESLVKHLLPLGPEITIDSHPSAGDNIIACWPGASGRTEGGFLIMCHFDTVHPIGMLEENPARVQHDRVYGPGSLDMKASITQTIFALRALSEQGRWPEWPIRLLLTSDEEIGSECSRPLIEELGATAELVLCMEPSLSNGGIKTSRKGVAGFSVVSRGIAAHAGVDHAMGINAIQEMAHQVLALHALTDYERGSTVSIGKISGGTRSNVVPDECKTIVDVRVETPEEGDRLQAAIMALEPRLKGASVIVRGGLTRPPMPRTPEIAKAYRRAQSIGKALGQEVGEGSTGGGSDANFIAPLGVPILDGLGPTGSGAHTRTESITVNSLPSRTALLAGILSEWTNM